MSAAKMTSDHEVIRRWVEKHGGHPAAVKRTRSKGDVGMLRIDFTVANSASIVRRIAYRFDWIDRNGTKAWSDESWKPLYLYEYSHETLVGTAPAPTAVDFRLVLLDNDVNR